MSVKIWIDDMRTAPDGFLWCKTYESAIEMLDYFSSCNYDIKVVDFDHDLGEEKSGYDVAKYIVEYQLPIGSFRVHSMNPVGRRNIEQLLTHYGYKERNFL